MSDRAVIIYYDDIDVFNNVPCPTPFVSLSNSVINYGKKHGQLSSLTLQGIITGVGNISGESGTYQRSLNLLSGFSKNFKTLKIVDQESTGTLFEEKAKVNNISFSESTFAAASDFTINIECYQSGLFPEHNGIIDPEDSFDFTRSDNGSVTLVRTVSARGFDTNSATESNALQNAINYVSSRTGLSAIDSYSLGHFISGTGNGNNLILTSQSENIDRFSANYSIVEEYEYQELNGTDAGLYGNLTYPIYKTCNFSYSPSSLNSPIEEASFNINFKTTTGDKAFSYLRSGVAKYVNELKAANTGLSTISDAMVQTAYRDFDLQSGAIFYNVNENKNERSIDVTLNISNDKTFDIDYGVYFQEDFSVQTDTITEISNIEYNFEIRPFGLSLNRDVSSATYHYIADANDLMKRSADYFNSKYPGQTYTNVLTDKCKTAYSGVISSNSDEINKITVIDITKNDNQNDGTISLSCSATNKEVFTANVGGIIPVKDGDYSYECSVPRKVVKYNKSSLNNNHSLINQYDDLYTRQNFSINLNGRVPITVEYDHSNKGGYINLKTAIDNFVDEAMSSMTGLNSNIESRSLSINDNGSFTASKTVSSQEKINGYKALHDPHLYSRS